MSEPTTTATPRGLLNFAELCGLLGVSERKGHELRAAGVIGTPLDLGPRASRWTHADFEATLQRLPRRAVQAEPGTLAQGRRARIERLKAEANPA